MRAPVFQERPASARALALQVLLECGQGDGYVREVLDRRLEGTGLSALDRRLTTQLSYGVLRRRATLDALLEQVCKRPQHQVEPWLWNTLRLGAFQLALLAQIPPHAAVNATVELMAELGREDVKGFVNGVLRGIEKLVTPERLFAPAPNALPLENGEYRRLCRPVLPDPATNPVEYVAKGHGIPAWLVARWTERYSLDECHRLGFWFGGPAPLWLRTNPLRAKRSLVLEALGGQGIKATVGNHRQAIRLDEPAAIRMLPGYLEGWFSVQDESSMQVASALAPQPGWHVLDLCAAPGGKTSHLVELMGDRGEIVACDVDPRRLEILGRQCTRLGATIVQPFLLGAAGKEEPPTGPFDAALVDVPCSNTGVLGKRPEVRWRLRPDDFRRLVPLQTRLLTQAAKRVKAGGVIIYSTCSIEPEENQQVVQTVQHAIPDLVLEAEQEQIPGRSSDGGYWARLRRRSLEDGGD
jgi:16S rRNA (cytosine967-C5)-methyltransferase